MHTVEGGPVDPPSRIPPYTYTYSCSLGQFAETRLVETPVTSLWGFSSPTTICGGVERPGGSAPSRCMWISTEINNPRPEGEGVGGPTKRPPPQRPHTPHTPRGGLTTLPPHPTSGPPTPRRAARVLPDRWTFCTTCGEILPWRAPQTTRKTVRRAQPSRRAREPHKTPQPL